MNIENLTDLTKHFTVQKLQNVFRLLDSAPFESLDDKVELGHKDFSNGAIVGQLKFSSTGEKLLVAAIRTSTVITDRTSKKKQYEIARSIIKNLNCDALLVAFYDKEGAFRLSLVRTQYHGPTRTWSNWHRYTYFVHPSLTNKTFIQQLNKCSFKAINDIENAFSVEAVNSEFYKSIAKLYDELVGASDEALINYSGTNEASYQFAVRLIGRIVFCWFLREKHSSEGTPLISKAILSAEAANQADYYHSTLAPLFFEVLNKPIDKRAERFQEGDFGKVPYLNGGLFAPQEEDYYRYDKILELSVPGLLDVPDAWIRKVFDLLELYHFTVDENTSVDIELSIDPEMLGRIFENLLARINPETGETVRKTTGSFYTPREIVEYMVDESLLQYLKATSIDEEKLRALISYDLLDDLDYPLERDEKELVIKFLHSVKILDPACGSGAFPIGILQKIVFMLQQIDPDAKLWFENQIAHAGPEARDLIAREFKYKNFDYIRKLGVIRESIFGVDIQPIATEIARLRCFLTLIVDERVNDDEDNRGVYPLPNLDFKFVTANSLIKLGKTDFSGGIQAGLFEDKQGIEELKQLRDDYFNSHNSEREILKVRFVQAQNRMLQNMIANHSHGFSDVTQKLSTWDPFTLKSTGWFDPEWMFGLSDGFNIVIANPPYIQIQKMDENTKQKYKNEAYSVFSKTTDIYCLFYEFGMNTIADNGVLCYITSNSWLRAKYGESLRKLLASYNPLALINFDDSKIFASAVVETNILLVRKSSDVDSLLAVNYNLTNKSKLSVSDYIKENGIELTDLDPQGWTIGEQDFIDLKQKLKNDTVLLKDSNVSIYRGFTTGFNEAYFIDSETRAKLIAEDPKCEEIIKPAMRGKDISQYSYKWSGIWVILLKAGWTNAKRDGQDPEEYFSKTYPSIYKYFKHVAENVSGKGKGMYARDDHGDYWWELRSCVYYDEFTKEKVMWGELSDKPKFAYDTETHFANNSIFFMTGKNLKYILAILNSKLGKWYFDQIATSSGMGTNRWLKYKIEQLPIRNITSDNRTLVDRIIEVSEQAISSSSDNRELTGVINKLVYDLYELSGEEIAIIEANKQYDRTNA